MKGFFRIRKRGSLVLALALICLLAALPVRADTASGTCGDGFDWTLSENGTLTISGSGEMAAYSGEYVKTLYRYVTTAPWGTYSESITHVTLGEGITSVGSNAFLGCAKITSVSLPDRLAEVLENVCENFDFNRSQFICSAIKERLERLGVEVKEK